MDIAFYYKFEEKTLKQKIKLDKFIQSSEINYAKILWLQVNQQMLEEGQNFINLKHTLRLEKEKMSCTVICRELVMLIAYRMIKVPHYFE